MGANPQAEKLKEHGNTCFSKGKLDAAIEAYTQCLDLDPRNPVYFTNRALCHHKKEVWPSVVSDCSTALSLDRTSVKAHYLLGSALVEQGNYPDGTEALHRALELCKDRTISYKEDILRALLSARKRRWEAGRSAQLSVQTSSEALVTSLLQQHFASQPAAAAAAADAARAGVEACVDEALAMRRARHTPRQVPDYLCCKISMEIMLDPVTTPCGITYERSSLRQHLAALQAKGEPGFDPITRQPLRYEQVVPNLALKEAIEVYLQQHPWAYECDL